MHAVPLARAVWYTLSSTMPLQRIVSGDTHGRVRSLAERMLVIGLFDAYAELLTERQRTLVRMYYLDDLSLGEIAARRRISRQAVSDALRRSVAEMQRLEHRLGVAATRKQTARTRAQVLARLEAVEGALAQLSRRDGAAVEPVRQALGALREAL